MTVYGINKDGTMGMCKARPENRGRGNCPHADHVDMERLKPKELIEYNENIIREKYNIRSTIDINYIPDIKIDKIGNVDGGVFLNRDEFSGLSTELALHFPSEEWSVISEFYHNINAEADFKRLDKTLINRPNSTKAVLATETATLKVQKYLQSDDRVAKTVRDFLGKEVNADEISKLLVNEVGSMKAAQSWRNTPNTSVLKRAILTTVGNDMTRERYVASVLFFGGRCCYCNRVLRKSLEMVKPKPSEASGEHITPLSPREGDIVGGTRYGNMALACQRCNADRGNQELNAWMKKTRKVPAHNKEASLNRIKTFRKFALYRDYTPFESKILLDGVKQMEDYISTFKVLSSGKFADQDAQKIDAQLKMTMYDLNEKLRQL